VEKAGEEIDGETSNRPCRGPDPEGSMAAAPAVAGSRVLWVGSRVWEASAGRPESRTATGRWRRSEAGSGRGENAASRAKRVTHLFICDYTINNEHVDFFSYITIVLTSWQPTQLYNKFKIIE
jgi:hypothetical protein